MNEKKCLKSQSNTPLLMSNFNLYTFTKRIIILSVKLLMFYKNSTLCARVTKVTEIIIVPTDSVTSTVCLSYSTSSNASRTSSSGSVISERTCREHLQLTYDQIVGIINVNPQLITKVYKGKKQF